MTQVELWVQFGEYLDAVGLDPYQKTETDKLEIMMLHGVTPEEARTEIEEERNETD